MTLAEPLPLDRVHLLNPGQHIAIGDRTLTAVKPPAFDNPVTTGFYDSETGGFFSCDCFGALLESVPPSATELSDDQLRQGQIFWATVNSPWLHRTDCALFAEQLDFIREMEPRLVLSCHLPAAPGAMLEQLLRSLEAVPAATPFTGPDQAALEQLLAQMTSPQGDRHAE